MNHGMGRPREPIFNAPWPSLALIGSLAGSFFLQAVLGADSVAERFGFAAQDLARGDWPPLVTSLFLHGSWAHLAANCAFGLAFASPVAWRFGTDGKGALFFFGFFLVCGVLSNLGYAAMTRDPSAVVIGASGAIAGLMGATSRLMGRGPGLARLDSRPVLGMAGAWILVNLIVAAVGWSPGAGGAKIAWQAHLAGYAAGVFLLGPTLRLARRF